ncbi:MAG TPA: potassium-transporting ATPase subunit KdpA [Burkholderiales bacterium]|jgi:K+-transporting ATPase ATPase A chain
MTSAASSLLIQCVFYLVALLALAKPLGEFFARVLLGEQTFLNPVLGWMERFAYRASGVDEKREMRWTEYAIVTLVFNLAGLFAVYALQRVQHLLPLNPAGLAAVSADSSWNTAVSFATNTNWQGYGGESTMSYLTQMLALAVQNFVSAATGIAVLAALARAFSRRQVNTIGNFWSDLTRSTLYILLPLSLVLALALVSQGVVQNFKPYVKAQTVEKIAYEEDKARKSTQEQILPMGPAASQIAIKQLGTNGGGFFNVNSAHPYENPTPVANFLEMLSILMISGALCITFGRMVGDPRQGWAVLAAMTILLVGLLAVAVAAEQSGNPILERAGASADGNMEGKEVRFGIANSAIWAVATTAASNGSVNAMHDSFTPLGGLVPMWLMQLGEVVFGGVGSGLYGMVMMVLVAVFVAGLMIGRTPEYLGKKVEAFEMKMASVAILLPPLVALVGTAIAVLVDPGKAGVANPGAHGFSEILYAFSSAGNNNGSAFGGLSANTPFYNVALGFAMLISRYWLIIPVLAIAGSFAAKKTVPVGPGTLPTHTPLFIALIIGTVILVGALTFVPALALGPIIEHLQMIAAK